MTMASQTLVRRYLITALLLLPLLVISVFPQGTMAARGVQGMEVVLCTGYGPVTVTVDETGTPIEEQHGANDCGWWLHGQGLCFADLTVSPVLITFGFRTLTGVIRRFTKLQFATTDYPVRAPPVV